MKEYLPRISDKLLKDILNAKGAVLIEGPKWCGKTTTAKQIAKSIISMEKPDMTRQYQQMAELSPNILLEGETPRLIDEWQIAHNLWNAVRYEVDNRDEFGQFILTGSFDQDTLYSYLDALRKIFVIEDSPAWNPNLRSKISIRTTDTRYFSDPSIATAALGIGPKDLLDDLNTMGFLFENLCIRDLRIYADYLDGTVYHYRDRYGLECDAVIHLRNGSYGLIEIKLGGDKLIEEGAKNLKELASKIDTKNMPKPSFMAVLCAKVPFAYKRIDGVYVIPITKLKP